MLRLIFVAFLSLDRGGLSQDLQRDLEEAINMYRCSIV